MIEHIHTFTHCVSFPHWFHSGRGVVVVPSVSDPVGISRGAVLGAGHGGGIDKQWLPPNTQAFENAPTCWGFEVYQYPVPRVFGLMRLLMEV
jgi:hypothetical protein